jgi:ABC-type microcin C transport system duplicated ATPase subunit YejF
MEDDRLEQIAEHGNGEFERALALVKLAESRGELSYLERWIENREQRDSRGDS